MYFMKYVADHLPYERCFPAMASDTGINHKYSRNYGNLYQTNRIWYYHLKRKHQKFCQLKRENKFSLTPDGLAYSSWACTWVTKGKGSADKTMKCRRSCQAQATNQPQAGAGLEAVPAFKQLAHSMTVPETTASPSALQLSCPSC